jgi:hypothetical protein
MSLRPGISGTFRAAQQPAASTTAGVIDLVNFPRMGGAEVLWREPAVVCYIAPGDPARALLHCAKPLDELGWHESRKAGPRFVSRLVAQGCYEKSGYILAFSARPTPRQRGMVTVSLQNMGNLDTRTLPRPGDATLLRGYKISTTYATSSPVPAVADVTRSALVDLGWHDYTLVDSRHDEWHEYQIFRLAKDGIALTVRASRSLIRRGRTLVQYSPSLVSTHLEGAVERTVRA